MSNSMRTKPVFIRRELDYYYLDALSALYLDLWSEAYLRKIVLSKKQNVCFAREIINTDFISVLPTFANLCTIKWTNLENCSIANKIKRWGHSVIKNTGRLTIWVGNTEKYLNNTKLVLILALCFMKNFLRKTSWGTFAVVNTTFVLVVVDCKELLKSWSNHKSWIMAK